MLRLTLRNRVADWGLAALAAVTDRPRWQALVAFADQADAGGIARLSDDDTGHLLADGEIFESIGQGVRLQPSLIDNLDELRERVSRFDAILADSSHRPAPFEWGEYPPLPQPDTPEPDPVEQHWTLVTAGLLYRQGLYFEVHELLEPCWLRLRGADRLFWQGLIQIAVGLHHHSNGNLRGALALLDDGNATLKPFRPAHNGMELDRFCEGIDRCSVHLSHSRLTAHDLPQWQTE